MRKQDHNKTRIAAPGLPHDTPADRAGTLRACPTAIAPRCPKPRSFQHDDVNHVPSLACAACSRTCSHSPS